MLISRLLIIYGRAHCLYTALIKLWIICIDNNPSCIHERHVYLCNHCRILAIVNYMHLKVIVCFSISGLGLDVLAILLKHLYSQHWYLSLGHIDL